MEIEFIILVNIQIYNHFLHIVFFGVGLTEGYLFEGVGGNVFFGEDGILLN